MASDEHNCSIDELQERLRESLRPQRVPLSRSISYGLCFGLLALSIAIIYSIAVKYFNLISLLGEVAAQKSPTLVSLTDPNISGLRYLTIMVGAVFISPIVEEIIFRGGFQNFLFSMQGKLLEWRCKNFGKPTIWEWALWAKTSVIAWVALLFALCHPFIAVSFIPLVAVSVCCSLAYIRAKSIWAPIVAHILYNSVVVLLTLIQAR